MLLAFASVTCRGDLAGDTFVGADRTAGFWSLPASTIQPGVDGDTICTGQCHLSMDPALAAMSTALQTYTSLLGPLWCLQMCHSWTGGSSQAVPDDSQDGLCCVRELKLRVSALRGKALRELECWSSSSTR